MSFDGRAATPRQKHERCRETVRRHFTRLCNDSQMRVIMTNAITKWKPRLNEVYCMDALTLLDSLPDASVDATITDMPYGVTACAWDTVIDLDQWWREVKRIMKPRGAVVMTATQPFTSELVMSNRDWFRYEWVIIKNMQTNPFNADSQPLRKTETCLIFGGLPPLYYPIMKLRDARNVRYKPSESSLGTIFTGGNKKQNSVPRRGVYRYPDNVLHWNNHPYDKTIHPTQKPVALMEYLIRTYTLPGQTVLDPFAGSGTTAVAARNLNRNYITCDNGYDERTGRAWADITRDRLQRTDPFQHTQVTSDVKQLSLWGDSA